MDKKKNSVERLSESLDIRINKRKSFPTFKTKEVVCLLLVTVVIGLMMGGLVTYNIVLKGSKVDDELQEFIENYDYVVDNYYGDVDKSSLIDSAIAGMLNALDKNSTYVGGSDSNFSIFLEGNYKGTGIQVMMDDESNIVIYTVFDGTPASKAGLRSGDIIIKLNNKDVTDMDLEEFSDLVKEQKDEFKITYIRNGKEYKASLKTENVTIEFEDAAIDRMSFLAADVNSRSENIGARRLHTIMETLLEDLSFEADEHAGETIVITSDYVDEKLKNIVENQDLSKYIL